MPKKSLKPTSALLVTPVVLVTCQDQGTKPNIITLAWVGVANSDPPKIRDNFSPISHPPISLLTIYALESSLLNSYPPT